jgi:hypothetical protein
MARFFGSAPSVRAIVRSILSASVLLPLALAHDARAQQTPLFTPGNLVVVVEGCGVYGGTCTSVANGTGTGIGNSSVGGYGDNQAAPLTLFQFAPTGTTSATYVNSLVLPQTGSGANLPLAGEYGSSSEGGLQLSGQGQYLTLGAYGINAATFNAAPTTYGAAPSLALAQSGSLTGQSYTPIPRVVTLIDPFGNVNSSSAIYNIFNTNNPRSVYTANGTTAYLSGQGASGDATGGVFYTPLGAVNNTPTAITGLDTTSNTVAQDTRFVTVYNNTLYVSVDTKGGSNNARSFIGTLGTPPATSLFNNSAGPTQIAMANNAPTPNSVSSAGKITLTASEANTVNASAVGSSVNLSPSGFFFANAYTLYIADTGNGKQTSASKTLGAGGLQKWVNTKTDGTGTWELMYTMSLGLNLVTNPATTPSNTSGTTGLYGLAGVVVGNNVYLYATNATIADLDPTYIYGITDPIAATSNSSSFTLLATAPADSNFKGISFAPSLPTGAATITTVPAGLPVTTAGTGCAPGTYVTPVTLVWTPGSACTLSTTTPQTSGTTPYVFSQWQDGTTATTDSVVAPSSSATYTATFTNTYQPVGVLEKVADNTTSTTGTVQAGDSVLVSGWVADPVDGAPMSNVKVLVDGNMFGTPTLGGARTDVAATYGAAYTNSGYQLVAPSTALALGTHAVTVVAVDTSNRSTTFGPLSFNLVATPAVTVTSSSIVAGTATTTLTAQVAYTANTAPAPVVSFTVNGSATGVGAVSCTGVASPFTCTASYASSSALAGSYPVVATVAASNSSVTGSGMGTLTVTPATPTVTVAAGSIVAGTASTTLSASVAYAGSVAKGPSVSFTVNGSATGVGTATCTGSASPVTCTATYASSSLAAGSYPIVATVTASSSLLAASGSGTLTVTPAPNFTVDNGSGSSTVAITVPAGTSNTGSVKLTSANGFAGTVALACSGAGATGMTCTVTPSLALTAAGTATATVTINTTARTTATASGLGAMPRNGRGLYMVLAMMLAAGAFLMRKPARNLKVGGLLMLLFALAAGISGCGSSSSLNTSANPNGTPAGTYSYTVTATSGAVSHTETVSVTVL